jgi:hypothetical protein
MVVAAFVTDAEPIKGAWHKHVYNVCVGGFVFGFRLIRGGQSFPQ